jgi:hypothetical protein
MAIIGRGFEIGFWHPFGPHGLETPEQILERKQGEIRANGWTLWSFQYRTPSSLEAWSRALRTASPSAVPVVYCSNSGRAVDPAKAGVSVRTTECRSYQLTGEDEWRTLPAGVRVPHPFRRARRMASAFIVQRITYPVEPFTPPVVEWFTDSRWSQDRLPTRGEYLIRPGGHSRMRTVRAILDLRAPFLAVVRADKIQPG